MEEGETERQVDHLLPSSASSSSSTPVSWHFLLWAFDFMCLVRFPGKERDQTQAWLEGRGQGRPRARRGSLRLAGHGSQTGCDPANFRGWAGACTQAGVCSHSHPSRQHTGPGVWGGL